MAKKPDITTIASGYYSRQALNTNFENIEDKFDNTLSRDGSTPNAMGADLDMNSNDIQNVNALDAQSITLAGTDITNILNSESAAAASATAAADSALEASGSATSAQSAQTAAESAYDSFDDRYLGAKSSAPSTDNDGSALITGALYWNSTGDQLYIWDGSAWNAGGFVASGAVSSFNTRTGAVTLSAADVSGATGLLSTNNLSDVGSASTARTNLGLGSSDSVTFGQISLADNDYIKLGDNNELNIFSNNGSSKISEAGSGNFTIEGDNLILQDVAGNNYLYGTAGGQVRLFYNNDAKVTTTNTGVEIDGDLTVTRTGNHTVDLNDLRGFVSVKEYGAVGDESSNDAQAFVDAMAAGRTVLVPAGTYRISTAMTFSGHFIFEEGAKIKANAALVFNMSIEAGQYQIGEHGTGSIEWGLPHEICVEWFGLNTTNSAANNKTNYENFLKYSDPDTYPYVVKFGRGSYDYEAPFYVRDRITIEGQSMFASELDLQGSDVHGVETCQIVSNAILTDGVMYSSANYAHMRNMEIECSDMIMTGTTKKFVYYAAALSSSIVENNRFDSPSSSQNQMDGIFLGPTASKEISTYTIPTSGVNISTDEITYTDHGYLTGDAIKYQDGGGTALAGLTDNTQYFAIRVSNNVFQVASSLSNAQAGTEINLTGTGNNAQTFEYEGNDRARAANRTIIRENRISNCRDGIVLGRHNQSKTDAEPAGGGSGDNVGGACFENTIGPRNYLVGASGNNVRPRFGIVCHYYNQGSGIASRARPKPYANNIYGNSVLEYGASTSSLSGTIAVSNASATVTGTSTAFTTELPNDLTSGVARKLAIGFTHSGTDYMFEVASIDSATQITLKNAGVASLLPNIGTVSNLTVDKIRSGVGLYTGSTGQNIVFRDHYTDHWCFPMKIESNTKAASFYDNHHAGAPFLPYEDESASDSQVYVRYHSPIAYSARTNGAADGIDAELKYYKGLEIDRESGSVLTIASGAITALSNFHTVATEGGASTDNLDNIYNGHVGQVLILGAADGGDDVVLRDGVGGNLRLAGSFTLDTLTDRITLLYDGTNWNELARSNNG